MLGYIYVLVTLVFREFTEKLLFNKDIPHSQVYKYQEYTYEMEDSLLKSDIPNSKDLQDISRCHRSVPMSRMSECTILLHIWKNVGSHHL